MSQKKELLYFQQIPFPHYRKQLVYFRDHIDFHKQQQENFRDPLIKCEKKQF
jgi:hypothetical protein